MRTLELPGVKKVRSGKVREMFEVGDNLLMVASDRMSAFDVVLPDTIPGKGKILTQISEFWFDKTSHIVPNHVLETDARLFPEVLADRCDELTGRSMLVRKAEPLAIECVVRGYLAGSGWKDYQATGAVCGILLPPGLRESDQLPELIFTPATKAEKGHDENISFDKAVEIVGADVADAVRDISLQIYTWASEYARNRGIIICDTKFEFGHIGSELVLIDEVLTPDSSRFWPADEYAPGGSQPSFDKQYIRDYLETLDWNKKAPGPSVPQDVIQATTDRYLQAYRLLTGQEPTL